MNQPSVKDALEKLRAQILESIRGTEEVILHAANDANYALAASLRSEVLGREAVVYMIDDMLAEIDEPKAPRQ